MIQVRTMMAGFGADVGPLLVRTDAHEFNYISLSYRPHCHTHLARCLRSQMQLFETKTQFAPTHFLFTFIFGEPS
jgi:hypothetical protein